jgi:homoserine O-succinyltransferase
MPLVAHSNLPAFERLREDGQEVLNAGRAKQQDIRELHIGLLNMMPDAALQATERQFLRLIGSCNRIAQFYVHLFTIGGIERQGEAKIHIERYYEDFRQLQQDGLDALVITGANPAHDDITDEPYWRPMAEVLAWGREHVCSIVCSCLATHADLKLYHNIDRIRLPQKRWGVYSHRLLERAHPLVSNINTRFDAPHSHLNEVTREQVEAAGSTVLAYSEQANVHLAVSPDQFRLIYFQGHPEYDINSLLKEYKRELGRFINDERPDYPPYPENYFAPEAIAILEEHKRQVESAKSGGKTIPRLPEKRLHEHVDNTWTDTGKAMFNNWLGLIYQLTHRDRKQPFMAGVDPHDPLGLKHRRQLAESG